MPRLHIILIALLFLLPGCGDGDGPTGGNKPGDNSRAANPYPDSVDGLKSLMNDLSAAANSGDASATALADGLILKDAAPWFKATFGDDKAAALASEYAAATRTGADGLIGMMNAQKAKNRTEFIVDRFTDAKDPNACAFQEAALEAAKGKLTISSWRAVEPGKKSGQHVYNFVHIDGQWRFVGPLKALKPDLAADAKMNALSSLRAKDREEFFKSGKLPD